MRTAPHADKGTSSWLTSQSSVLELAGFLVRTSCASGSARSIASRSSARRRTSSSRPRIPGWRWVGATASRRVWHCARRLSPRAFSGFPTSVGASTRSRNELTLAHGDELPYDYLVITTGPKLAFEEVPGLGPAGFTQSVCTQDARACSAWERYQEFVQDPGPDRDRRGRRCQLLRSGIRVRDDRRCGSAQTQDPRPRTDDLS